MASDSLIKHRDFRLLWGGQTVSELGTFVTQMSVPLLAALVLAATPLQMGLLGAAENAAFLLIGLPAGVWVDRMRRRRLMITADLVRAALLLSVPVTWWLGGLTIAQLILVSLGISVCTVFFDVAYQSYLPALVGREKLVEGNAKLQSTFSIAQISGTAIGGGLTQLVGAANALLVDAGSFLFSVLTLWRIRTVEQPVAVPEQRSLRREVGEGLRFVFGNRNLRAIVGTTSSNNLCTNAFFAVAVLFLTRQLHLPAGLIGLLSAAIGIGGVLGALASGAITRRVGQARTIWLSVLITSPFLLLLPATKPGLLLGLWVVGSLVFGIGVVVYNVAQVSFRQAICPDRLLGRMNATVRFVVWGTMPVGALLGGALGTWIGVHTTLWVAAIGAALSPLFVTLSPLRTLRDIPTDQPDAVSVD
ncbi:MAG: MFS transporter [Sciscionella sp.]|nr:MFS transporter [Sciscionella sp.]